MASRVEKVRERPATLPLAGEGAAAGGPDGDRLASTSAAEVLGGSCDGVDGADGADGADDAGGDDARDVAAEVVASRAPNGSQAPIVPQPASAAAIVAPPTRQQTDAKQRWDFMGDPSRG